MIDVILIVAAALMAFGGICILCVIAPGMFPDDPGDDDQDGSNAPVGVDRQ